MYMYIIYTVIAEVYLTCIRELASVRARVVCCAGGLTYVRELAPVRVVLETLARESFALSLRYRSTYCNRWECWRWLENHMFTPSTIVGNVGTRTPHSHHSHNRCQRWQENYDRCAIYSIIYDYGAIVGSVAIGKNEILTIFRVCLILKP